MNRGVNENYWKRSPLLVGLLIFNFNTYAGENISTYQSKLDSLSNEKQYLKALKTADEITFKHEFEHEFMLLINDQQKEYYLNLFSLEERKNYIEYYWKANNPDPILPENDVLKEHLRRRSYVRKYFSKKEFPYFDARGKYYIKYGKPAVRFQDTGGLKQLSFLEMREDPNADYMVRFNESWSYENIAPDFIVHFARNGQAFQEIKSLTDIIISPRRRSKQALQWMDIVKKRASFSPAFGRVAAQIEEIETNLRINRPPIFKNNDAKIPKESIFEVEKENRRKIEKAALTAPPSAHDPINAVNELSFVSTIEQFAELNGMTRIEVTFFSSFANNFLRNFDYTKNSELEVEFSALLRNTRFDPVAEDHMKFTYPVELASNETVSYAISVLTFFAPSHRFELTMQVKDALNNKIGFSRELLQVQDFSGKNLQISDLQFYTEITNSIQKKYLPTVEKQNTEIAPYPFPKVRKSVPLLCYFEIYHLISAGIKDEYEITYTLFTSDKKNLAQKLADLVTGSKDAIISFSFTQAVPGENSQELIGIDLSRVANGDYQLEITVSAVKDKSISASTSREITITE